MNQRANNSEKLLKQLNTTTFFKKTNTFDTEANLKDISIYLPHLTKTCGSLTKNNSKYLLQKQIRILQMITHTDSMIRDFRRFKEQNSKQKLKQDIVKKLSKDKKILQILSLEDKKTKFQAELQNKKNKRKQFSIQKIADIVQPDKLYRGTILSKHENNPSRNMFKSKIDLIIGRSQLHIKENGIKNNFQKSAQMTATKLSPEKGFSKRINTMGPNLLNHHNQFGPWKDQQQRTIIKNVRLKFL